ncbi:MAG: catalase, partial [Janthinobacterium lividum]
DFHRRDLWDAIDQGSFPEWELAVQLFDEDFASKFDFDILDSTKLIPEEILPLRVVGRMVLDRNPDNYFSETEQVAFCTTHVVPGIDFTNDPLLQGRNQSYLDTQLSRLGGPNFAQLPINAPRCPMRNFQRDGHMQMGIPKGRVSYSPSSLSPTTERQDPVHGFVSFPAHESGDKLRVRSETFSDHYSQARQFFFSQTEPEQNHIVAAFIFELSKVDTEVVRTMMLSRLANVDETLARRVAEGLGHDSPITKAPTKVQPRTDLAASPMLSILAKFKPTMKGRKVGCLVADGTDPAQVLALEAAAKAVGANFAVIAPKVGGAKGSDGGKIRADFQLAGGPSVLFDAVVLALSKEGAATLTKEAAAVAFVHDAFAHLKVIGHTEGAQALMDKAGVVTDVGVVGLSTPQAFLDAAGKGRVWDREPSVRSVF